ncbi:MAG: hypothetical protein WKF91_21420 [Segetibacter sp.]
MAEQNPKESQGKTSTYYYSKRYKVNSILISHFVAIIFHKKHLQ